MLPLRIAIRYLLAKKSHNAINAITLVASCGVAIITAAMICMLSVYNGFESLVDSLCSNFDPELKIEAKRGKTFADTDTLRAKVSGVDGVEVLSAVLEENVLMSYGNRQIPAIVKGVDEHFAEVTNIDTIIAAGDYMLKDEVAEYCVLGAGLATQLGAGSSFVRPLTMYCPVRSGKIDLMNPEDAFVEGYVYCSSIFMVSQAEYDDNLCITSLGFAREMTEDSTAVSAYEVKTKAGADVSAVKKAIGQRLGEDFSIKTRYEQQEESYKIMQIEKWITFLIVIFIMMIASFNVVGALSMLIIDKEKEIDTLANLGADNNLIRKIFAYEGILISEIGAAAGIVLGVVLCLLQEHFGIIGLGGDSGAYIVDAYPVVLHWSDVVWTALCVIIIGVLATIYPLKVIKKVRG